MSGSISCISGKITGIHYILVLKHLCFEGIANCTHLRDEGFLFNFALQYVKEKRTLFILTNTHMI